MKTVLLLDPFIMINATNYYPYETGLQKDVFIKWPSNSPDFNETKSSIMLGYVCLMLKYFNNNRILNKKNSIGLATR